MTNTRFPSSPRISAPSPSLRLSDAPSTTPLTPARWVRFFAPLHPHSNRPARPRRASRKTRRQRPKQLKFDPKSPPTPRPTNDQHPICVFSAPSRLCGEIPAPTPAKLSPEGVPPSDFRAPAYHPAPQAEIHEPSLCNRRSTRASRPLRPPHEHDACGIGFVANIKGHKSHDIIVKGIQVLINLTHRGACGCDPETGDGAGVLIQIPHAFFARECAELGFTLPAPGEYGVGMTFLPVERAARLHCEGIVEASSSRRRPHRPRLARYSHQRRRHRPHRPRLAALYPADFRRPRQGHDRGSARAQALRRPQARRSRMPSRYHQGRSTSRRFPPAPSSIKACCSRRRSRISIPS